MAIHSICTAFHHPRWFATVTPFPREDAILSLRVLANNQPDSRPFVQLAADLAANVGERLPVVDPECGYPLA